MANTYDPISTPGLLEPLRGTQPSEGYLVGKNPLIIGGKKMVEEGIAKPRSLAFGRSAFCIVQGLRLALFSFFFYQSALSLG